MRDDAPAESAPNTGSVDPDLLAIRSILDHAKRAPAKRREGPAEAERPERNSGNDAQPADRPLRRAVLARWLLGHAASFLRRPDAPRLLAVVVLLSLVLLKPGFVIFLAIMTLLAGLVLYLSVGPDRVQVWVIKRYDRLRDRDPAAADRLRKRAASVTRGLSAIVDRLPEHWTAGLYLPDFEEPVQAEKLKSDPFDRLIGQ